MVLSLKQSAQGDSLFKNVFPDAVLLIFAETFLITSLMISVDQLSLISNPIRVTQVFIILHSLLQIAIFLFIIPKVQPDMETSYTKKKGIKATTITSSIMFMCGFLLAAHCIAVIFGAPFFEDTEATSTWAATVTCLIALPVILILGPTPRKWILVFNCMKFENTQQRTLFYTTVGVVFVTWCSSVVIPLDWNTPWQKWPIPGIVGSILGYGIGLSYAIGKIIKDAKFSKVH